MTLLVDFHFVRFIVSKVPESLKVSDEEVKEEGNFIPLKVSILMFLSSVSA